MLDWKISDHNIANRFTSRSTSTSSISTTTSRVLWMALMTLIYSGLGCEDDPPPIPDQSQMAGESTAGMSSSVTRGMLTVEQPVPGSIISQSRVTVSGVHATASEVIVRASGVVQLVMEVTYCRGGHWT